MSNQLPGNLAEILPLRFRVRETLYYGVTPGGVIAEREKDQQRFSLKHWQYEMLTRFDGKRTFESIAKEVHSKFPGGFTAVGLLNFYNWLYHEDLVVCECESVFELVVEEEEEALEVVPDVARRDRALVKSSIDYLSKGWQREALKVSAMILFSLAVIRIAYVAAPIFEPPVDRLYAEVADAVSEENAPAANTALEKRIPDTPINEMELAGRIEPAPEPIDLEIPEPEVFVKPEQKSNPATAEKPDPTARIDALRKALAECRIRRDEFYLQNNESGYRTEVAKMADLAREIGEIESSL